MDKIVTAAAKVILLSLLVQLHSQSAFSYQTPRNSDFVRVDAPVSALTHVKIIDGTGGPAREGQTILIRGGRIEAVGAVGEVSIPQDAEVLDLAGRTVTPGFVMMHEHLFYPTGGRHYSTHTVSFARLYLAGGVTSVRTTGSMEPFADLNLKKAIDSGAMPGPDLDVTGPYLEGSGLPLLQVKALRGPDDAARMVNYWADEGVTSFKAYMHISREELSRAVREAHKRGLKVTGHLCSVTFREAADIGIDNLEHGFLVSTDFVEGKQPDECPSGVRVLGSIGQLDVDGPEIKALIDHLVAKGVAITSTLTVYETFTPGRPPASDRALDALQPEARDRYMRSWSRASRARNSPWEQLFKKEMELERAFVRAGGLLIVGTDPTGYGGVVPGYANLRAIELLHEAGFSPEEAISIATLNGARYLGREDRIGTIAVGKQADLAVFNGDVSSRIRDINRIELVFKKGVGYDSRKLFDSGQGRVGLH